MNIFTGRTEGGRGVHPQRSSGKLLGYQVSLTC